MPPYYGASISASLVFGADHWRAEQVYKRYLVLHISF